MIVRYVCIVFSLLYIVGLSAQSPDSEYYYPYSTYTEHDNEPLFSDTTIFYKAIQSTPSVYIEATDYKFMHIASKRRGLHYNLSKTITANGLKLPYRYITPLKTLSVEEVQSAGMRSSLNNGGGVGDLHIFHFAEQEPLSFYRAALNFTDKNYLMGVRISMAKILNDGWSLASSIQARTGRDLYVKGVFTNSLSTSIRLSKRFKNDNTLSLVAILSPTARGLRSSSSEEAFTLIGDNLYNPSWGFQSGKVRNSNVRREFLPLILASYHAQIGNSTSLMASFGAEMGWQSYSTLTWYNARTPKPDNYRYLPSFDGDDDVESAWRNNDTRYTQIDWDELYLQNKMSADGHAIYAVEDRVERQFNRRAAVNFVTHIDNLFSISYGVNYNNENSRYYKNMRDLMGAENIIDIDQFLVDDDMFSNKLQNNLENPNREILEGDKFGYDYSLKKFDVGVWALAQYRADRFRAEMAVGINDVTLSREGYYTKELFLGSNSRGKSRESKFTPYTLKALFGWSFSARSYLEAIFMMGGEAPERSDIFLQPLYNNRIVDRLKLQRIYASELNYRYLGNVAELHISAFAISTLDELDTRRYYDDISAQYCDMVVTGIGKLHLGVEMATSIQISRRWRAMVATSFGRYIYSENPRLFIYSDVDNSAIDIDAESQMGGCKVGGTPHISSTLTINYYGRNGWGFNSSVNYAGFRYVEPVPMRRTKRVTQHASVSEEAFDLLTSQERLDDALTFDVSLFKTLYFDSSRLVFALMLRNIFNDRDIIYSAHESSRIRKVWSGDSYTYTPFDSRHTYAYPRSFYLSVSYKF